MTYSFEHTFAARDHYVVGDIVMFNTPGHDDRTHYVVAAPASWWDPHILARDTTTGRLVSLTQDWVRVVGRVPRVPAANN